MKQESLFTRAPGPPQPIEQVQGVSKVVDYIRRLISLNKVLAGIRVRGEVSGLSNKNGRLYFKLKEGNDVLECVVWAGDAVKLPPFKDGDEIICGGEFATYAPRSQYQLMVKSVELTGAGVLFAQFEALKEKFRKEGLFEDSRKRLMPEFPRRVAVISAKDGRGVEDFFATIAREAPFIQVLTIATRVEGDGAEIDIAEAIDKASRMDVDAIVLTRGGGSYESLFPFNREPVVRAIIRAKHPVLSAIGHKPDVHLSDFVADVTCETPSNAAHYFGAIGKRYLALVRDAQAKLNRAIDRIAVGRAQRFDIASTRLQTVAATWVQDGQLRIHRLERRLSEQRPHARLQARAQSISRLASRLDALRSHSLTRYRQRADRATRALEAAPARAVGSLEQRWKLLHYRLEGMDPRGPLMRGYAIVTFDGRAVRDASNVPDGAVVEAQLQRGRLRARVEGKESDG